MKLKKLLGLALASTMALSMVACGSTDDTNQDAAGDTGVETSITTIQQGVLTVGTEAKYAPYEFKMLKDGEEVFAGFDMDLAREIAADLELELKIVDLPFDALMLELQAGNIDMAIAGMSPTEQRAQVADFSDLYFFANQAIVINTDKVGEFNTIEDLAGLQVAAQTGSLQADYAAEILADSKYIGYTDIPEIILELQAGNVDCAVIEETIVKALMETNPNLAIMDLIVDEEQPGNVVVMPKGSTVMVDAVNLTIDRVLNDGTMDASIAQAYTDMQNQID